MKNHYKVLQISRNATGKEIKNKTKELIEQIKNSNLSLEEKKNLSNKVYKSYKFLTDYHQRKSLDDHLDSQYKIIEPKKEFFSSMSFDEPFFNDDFGLGLISSLGFPKINLDKIKNDKNSKTYFYSKSSSTTGNLDENGNYVTKTKEYINNNGKEDKKEYQKTIKKEDIGKNNFKNINF